MNNVFAEFNQPGTHSIILDGEIGSLEVELVIPNIVDWRYVAILGHPHPLHGGTMHNKVVTTISAAYKNLNIPSIKFNFRGVGKSFGEYDSGIGESNDMLIIAKLWKQLYPKAKIFFAGFSFGSYVAYRASAKYQNEILEQTSLITVAPSVQNYDYMEYSLPKAKWLVVQGDIDEVVSSDLVYDFALQFKPPLPILKFENTSHFFHGKLIELKSRLTDYLLTQLAES
jgi:uncharacterized protein